MSNYHLTVFVSIALALTFSNAYLLDNGEYKVISTCTPTFVEVELHLARGFEGLLRTVKLPQCQKQFLANETSVIFDIPFGECTLGFKTFKLDIHKIMRLSEDIAFSGVPVATQIIIC
ncbi:uncharacterized protein LOC130671026 [Microplitis mediator]|uniref:uncharacterized protein LOC130671026 n=1 Tax=Microplitis mediator TaxID=375433 RepID=UPI0025548868|nr:uncharacterized protein LOC130671026 [Microplitis mediator]